MLEVSIEEANAVLPSSDVVEEFTLVCPTKPLLIEKKTALDFDLEVGKAHSKTGFFAYCHILYKAPQSAGVQDDSAPNLIWASLMVVPAFVENKEITQLRFL